LWRCRTLYNAALEQRITLDKRRGISITRYMQEAELKDLRADMPEDGALHSHSLYDVLARLDTPSHAFFRRVQRGENPGFPRFYGANRSHSVTCKKHGTGACLENGSLVLATLGRIAVRWSRLIRGSTKTVTIATEAGGWYAACSCAQLPTQPLPVTGKQVGSDVWLKGVLVTADGDVVDTPRHSAPLPQRPTAAHESPTPVIPTHEGQHAPHEGGQAARQGASARALSAPGLSPHDGTGVAVPGRCALHQGHATGPCESLP
jgi:putative transposase